jgi:hypothetical protein
MSEKAKGKPKASFRVAQHPDPPYAASGWWILK